MIIDTHGHLLPPDFLNTVRKEGSKLPSLKIIDNEQGLALGFGNAKPSRPAMKGLSDVAGRLAWMQKQGIDKLVNGGWPDWFGSDLPGTRRYCRARKIASQFPAPARETGFRGADPVGLREMERFAGATGCRIRLAGVFRRALCE